jgi:trafficking protein particle complex subunit 9
MFSPLAFPAGAMFYDLITHVPPAAHLALSPFDLYREPLVLLAIADGAELDRVQFGGKRQSSLGRTLVERNLRALDQELEDLRDLYPKVLVHQVMIFDYDPHRRKDDEEKEKNGHTEDETERTREVPIPEGIVTIPPPEKCKRTTMRTVMCDVSSLLLAEMTSLAKSYEAMTSIESPGQSAKMYQLNGGSDDGTGLQRRNSQYSLPPGGRSSSAGGVHDKAAARMSMPAHMSGFGSQSSTPGRPSTPVKSGLSNPPVTFDDMNNEYAASVGSPEQSVPSRPGTAEGFRSQSQDRVSVQGFGPGGLNERWRNKGKGRSTIVLGSLYLQAGRWTDALKELIDGATLAKSINDHLWHGKALELILITLLLLTWVDIEYQVPTVCMPALDKGLAHAIVSVQEGERDGPKHKWVGTLQVIMPELLERIVGLYSRISSEHLPPLPLAETTVRFCKMLAALYNAQGVLGEQAVEAIVLGKKIGVDSVYRRVPRVSVVPSRVSIANLLFRAFPNSGSELLTTVDRITILGGIASVLGDTGYQRKKAMVVRELVSVLIGGLVDARTRGAAEVGIHPAAGLVALNGVNGQTNGAGALELSEGDIEYGIDAFLEIMLKTYGVVTFERPRIRKSAESSDPEHEDYGTVDSSDEAIIARILRQSAARQFGMPEVKLNVLRACINLSEALPDFAGVLRFSSDLLRTAGSGLAPGPRREDASPSIPREEQMRLATNISKTSALSERLGLDHLSAEYWDEFLVRGVKLEPLPASKTPIAHSKDVLPNASKARASRDIDPFIYNPFLKQPDKAAVEHILVAGEPATFRLTLQNTYEMELDVESVRLDAEGVQFETANASTLIGPYRTQIIKLSGVPKGDGTLKITGAIIRIKGCRERRFPIFATPWAPIRETKIKSIGLVDLDMTQTLQSPAPPLKADSLDLTVIAAQPVVVVKSTSLPQSCVMILEGERQTFTVTLQNLSPTTPADFLLFSFLDSTQQALQAALSNRNATPAELYEYELILAKKQALRFKVPPGQDAEQQQKRFIPPGGTATFAFEILGKPGLTGGSIQIDYAFLGTPQEQVAEKFYTRRVALPMTVTVNASVEVARMDVLPVAGRVPGGLLQLGGEQGHVKADDYCLLLLDLRNAWPSNMRINLTSSVSASTTPTSNTETKINESSALDAEASDSILPGNTTRILLPLRRIFLSDPHAPIPALNPSRQRQFVVSTGKISPDVERANREAFWYREKVLEGLKGEWRTGFGSDGTVGGERSGSIELRSMRLTPRMVEALKVDEVGIDISVAGGGGSSSVVPSCQPLQLTVKIMNRTTTPIHPTLRLMPALSHRPLNVALDFTRKIAWNGTLQRTLPLLPGGQSVEVELGVTFLCRGVFEIAGSVEETRIWEDGGTGDGDGEKEKEKERKMADAALGPRERRIWHSRRPCRVIVKDEA